MQAGQLRDGGGAGEAVRGVRGDVVAAKQAGSLRGKNGLVTSTRRINNAEPRSFLGANLNTSEFTMSGEAGASQFSR